MARGGNPLPSSSKTNITTRRAGEERSALIEETVWAGVLEGKSLRSLARALECSHATAMAALARRRADNREGRAALRIDQIDESVARLQRLQSPLWRAAMAGDTVASRQILRLEHEINTLKDLYPDSLVEVSGHITFAQVPMEERHEALRLARDEATRRLKAMEVQGRVLEEPKALPAAKKVAAKKPAPKGQTKGTRRAAKSKVKQADQPKRKTAARTSGKDT